MIQEIMGTVYEAQRLKLYADAQEGAIAIGNSIEQSEGPHTRTVKLLEQYCELLYQVYNGQAEEMALDEHFHHIQNVLANEFEVDKLKILFVSYNASMSDSILSIYEASLKDSACEATWLPIPYYDRNADGTLGQMHYEGQAYYNQTIPCADWRQYDVKVERPDVILTFAPYDQCNRVTSIHPQYYCQELKKHTDLLVYVPYFILSKNVPIHFTSLEGCIHAHKVIVQSEYIQRQYAVGFSNTLKVPIDTAYDKFIGLGSPKIDRVINTEKGDCTIPEEWVKMIGNRKIVLYITSLGELLEGDAFYLQKIKSVIETFKDREDVILWWRPHPLSEATYRSMRGNLLQEYTEIVEQYKVSQYGIYDDTSELHRAIIVSDIYYGDRKGSVPQLYAATGKPTVNSKVEIVDGVMTTVKNDFENMTDNSGRDILKSMANYDGTAGEKIYEYCKSLI